MNFSLIGSLPPQWRIIFADDESKVVPHEIPQSVFQLFPEHLADQLKSIPEFSSKLHSLILSLVSRILDLNDYDSRLDHELFTTIEIVLFHSKKCKLKFNLSQKRSFLAIILPVLENPDKFSSKTAKKLFEFLDSQLTNISYKLKKKHFPIDYKQSLAHIHHSSEHEEDFLNDTSHFDWRILKPLLVNSIEKAKDESQFSKSTLKWDLLSRLCKSISWFVSIDQLFPILIELLPTLAIRFAKTVQNKSLSDSSLKSYIDTHFKDLDNLALQADFQSASFSLFIDAFLFVSVVPIHGPKEFFQELIDPIFDLWTSLPHSEYWDALWIGFLAKLIKFQKLDWKPSHLDWIYSTFNRNSGLAVGGTRIPAPRSFKLPEQFKRLINSNIYRDIGAISIRMIHQIPQRDIYSPDRDIAISKFVHFVAQNADRLHPTLGHSSNNHLMSFFKGVAKILISKVHLARNVYDQEHLDKFLQEHPISSDILSRPKTTSAHHTLQISHENVPNGSVSTSLLTSEEWEILCDSIIPVTIWAGTQLNSNHKTVLTLITVIALMSKKHLFGTIVPRILFSLKNVNLGGSSYITSLNHLAELIPILIEHPEGIQFIHEILPLLLDSIDTKNMQKSACANQVSISIFGTFAIQSQRNTPLLHDGKTPVVIPELFTLKSSASVLPFWLWKQYKTPTLVTFNSDIKDICPTDIDMLRLKEAISEFKYLFYEKYIRLYEGRSANIEFNPFNPMVLFETSNETEKEYYLRTLTQEFLDGKLSSNLRNLEGVVYASALYFPKQTLNVLFSTWLPSVTKSIESDKGFKSKKQDAKKLAVDDDVIAESEESLLAWRVNLMSIVLGNTCAAELGKYESQLVSKLEQFIENPNSKRARKFGRLLISQTIAGLTVTRTQSSVHPYIDPNIHPWISLALNQSKWIVPSSEDLKMAARLIAKFQKPIEEFENFLSQISTLDNKHQQIEIWKNHLHLLRDIKRSISMISNQIPIESQEEKQCSDMSLVASNALGLVEKYAKAKFLVDIPPEFKYFISNSSKLAMLALNRPLIDTDPKELIFLKKSATKLYLSLKTSSGYFHNVFMRTPSVLLNNDVHPHIALPGRHLKNSHIKFQLFCRINHEYPFIHRWSENDTKEFETVAMFIIENSSLVFDSVKDDLSEVIKASSHTISQWLIQVFLKEISLPKVGASVKEEKCLDDSEVIAPIEIESKRLLPIQTILILIAIANSDQKMPVQKDRLSQLTAFKFFARAIMLEDSNLRGLLSKLKNIFLLTLQEIPLYPVGSTSFEEYTTMMDWLVQQFSMNQTLTNWKHGTFILFLIIQSIKQQVHNTEFYNQNQSLVEKHPGLDIFKIASLAISWIKEASPANKELSLVLLSKLVHFSIGDDIQNVSTPSDSLIRLASLVEKFFDKQYFEEFVEFLANEHSTPLSNLLNISIDSENTFQSEIRYFVISDPRWNLKSSKFPSDFKVSKAVFWNRLSSLIVQSGHQDQIENTLKNILSWLLSLIEEEKGSLLSNTLTVDVTPSPSPIPLTIPTPMTVSEADSSFEESVIPANVPNRDVSPAQSSPLTVHSEHLWSTLLEVAAALTKLLPEKSQTLLWIPLLKQTTRLGPQKLGSIIKALSWAQKVKQPSDPKDEGSTLWSKPHSETKDKRAIQVQTKYEIVDLKLLEDYLSRPFLETTSTKYLEKNQFEAEVHLYLLQSLQETKVLRSYNLINKLTQTLFFDLGASTQNIHVRQAASSWLLLHSALVDANYYSKHIIEEVSKAKQTLNRVLDLLVSSCSEKESTHNQRVIDTFLHYISNCIRCRVDVIGNSSFAECLPINHIIKLIFELSMDPNHNFAKEAVSIISKLSQIIVDPSKDIENTSNSSPFGTILSILSNLASTHPLWQVRSSTLNFLKIFVYNHSMLFSNNLGNRISSESSTDNLYDISHLLQLVIALLGDTHVDVAKCATSTLSSIIKSLQPSNEQLTQWVDVLAKQVVSNRTKARKKVRETKDEVVEPVDETKLANLQKATRGLVALVNSEPYSVPSWYPRAILIIQALSSYSQNSISSLATEALSTFWKHHRDEWYFHQIAFTQEQLRSLEEKPGVSYYT